jgi:diguanylate cyclase (GGDEF)-like protein/PAS domain S-box-containing protein
MNLKKWLSGSLRRQLVLGVAGVHAVMMTFFVTDLALRQREFLQLRQMEEAQVLARTLARSASAWMLSRDMAGMQELVTQDASHSSITFAMLVSREGQVLAHSQRDRVGLYIQDAQRLREGPSGTTDPTLVLTLGNQLVDVAYPVMVGKRIIGWARVGVGQGSHQARLMAVTRDGMFYTLAAILIGALLATWMARRLTLRLQAIRDAAAAVSSGQSSARAELQGEDEAAVVARGFNTMLDTLAQEEDRLKATQAQLDASRERLDLALKGSNDGLWDWDLTHNSFYASPRWKGMLGYADDELEAGLEAWEQRVHPFDLASTKAAVEAHLAGHTPQYENVHRMRHKDGHWLWILDRGVCLRDEHGKAYRMVGTHTDITERVNLEKELSRYKRALDQHAIVSMTDAAGLITYANERFMAISGYSLPELLGQNHRILSPGLHPPEFFRDLWRTIASGHVWHGEICNKARDGHLFWVLTTIVPFLGDDGRPERYFSIRADISALKQAEQALHAEKELAQTTLASIGDAVITTDSLGRITFLNPVAEKLTGWHGGAAIGRATDEVLRLKNSVTGQPAPSPVDRCRAEGHITGMADHTVLVDRTGRERPIEDSAAPIRDKEGKLIGVVLVFHDVSDKQAMTRQMAWQLSHDMLTGLANRGEFERRLVALLKGPAGGVDHAMLYLDLDQFKVVNETCGHQAGDELLKRLAALFQAQLRNADTLARLGGDEFGVLLTRCPLDQAAEVAVKVRDLVRDFRFMWDDRSFEVGASVGVTAVKPGVQALADVMTAADMACYAAKEQGRNRVHVHDLEDADMAHRRQMLQAASGIRDALEEGRFQLYAQEIRPLHGGDSHYEVLLRMLDEDGTVLSPGVFIPAAERFGLMGEVDRWVVRTAFLAMARKPDLHLAINLSGLSLQDDDIVSYIGGLLKETGIAPERVCFEITETAAISNLGRALNFVQEMKTLGFRFALDDFGSGMSSFTYLKNLPVDYLKIDGAFVRDIVSDPIDRAFVETINRIGQVMGKETIAEYVENTDIMRELSYIGVNYAQGYGVAKPVPLEGLLRD